MSLVTVVGNPKPASRTYGVAVAAGEALARDLGYGTAPEVVDLAALAPTLLAPSPAAAVEVAIDLVKGADVLLVASPTYKGTYTGLLKVFLDRLPPGVLVDKIALPLLVVGDARHALAVEVHLRPLLVELGAAVPTPGLALLEADFLKSDEVVSRWAAKIGPQVAALRGGQVRV
ncbi:NADPH-dependent FMN reductase [Sinosporangium siamense]|uniref:FMN reductase n=1 Tax=Sinosporangium siamense TaxID=1367973 RepID=A0A919RGU9_9ACTN|nr:NAD(P)H-dependent oxidoreductase [Sinosporangium siamense]GII92540.1 FMN reductase [Sinosporangium siamense]